MVAHAIYWTSRRQAKTVGNKGALLWQKFPKFVLGFLLISILATYHFFSKDQTAPLQGSTQTSIVLPSTS